MSGGSVKLVKVENVTIRSLKERKICVAAPNEQHQQQIAAARQQAQQEFRQRLAAAQARTAQQQQQAKTIQTQLGAIEQMSSQQRPQQLQQMTASPTQNQQQNQQFAAQLLADIQTLFQQIDQGYAHEKRVPNRLEFCRRQLELVQANLQAGMSDAAIASAQQAYLNLTDLRLQLEQQEQACLTLYHTALEQVRGLRAAAQLVHQCEIEIGEGSETESIAIDVDYWTNGRLSQYEQQLQQLERQLTNAIDQFDSKALQQVNEQVSELAPMLEQLTEQAQAAVFNSQMRAEIADSIVDALSSLGYSLTDTEQDAIYEGDDQRQAYVVKVQNLAGDEIVAVISPEQEFGVNQISVNAFSESIVDETAARQNAQAVFDALESEGIEGISPLECEPSGKAEYRNMQTVRQRRTVQSSSKGKPNSSPN